MPRDARESHEKFTAQKVFPRSIQPRPGNISTRSRTRDGVFVITRLRFDTSLQTHRLLCHF